MSTTQLTWYLCGACLLTAFKLFEFTRHLDIPILHTVLPNVFGGGALLAGGAAVSLNRRPPMHRIHQSRALYISLSTVAIAITLLLVLLL